MREALQIVGEEGLEAVWDRHKRLHEKLWEGLSSFGLKPFVEDKADRLVTVNTIKVSFEFKSSDLKSHVSKAVDALHGVALQQRRVSVCYVQCRFLRVWMQTH